MRPHKLHVAIVDWQHDGDLCLDIRFEVFVKEQGVPADIEADTLDATAIHALAWMDGMAVGTGRLLPDGRIGRMAVRSAFRRDGVGRALMAALLEEADRRGIGSIHLHAQAPVRAFYEKLGFAVCGEPFVEAGIDHLPMRRTPA